ncbi:MAG: invasion associated locus B family protein, partial [Pseudolabrys sp.]
MNTAALFRICVGLLAVGAVSDSANAQQQQKNSAPAQQKNSAPAPAQKNSAPATAQKKSPSPTDQAVLLGQFGEWGAYRATPGGKKICFALSKPTAATSEPSSRTRDAAYAFVSTRPSEKVRNEVSVIVGYPQKAGHDATAAIGSSTYPMYTQNDGAWVKNAAEETQMVETMRRGSDLVVKSESARGTKTTDTYSLKGIVQA